MIDPLAARVVRKFLGQEEPQDSIASANVDYSERDKLEKFLRERSKKYRLTPEQAARALRLTKEYGISNALAAEYVYFHP